MRSASPGARTPLDLRLLPAALVCWAAAWAAVHLSGTSALRLGSVLLIWAVMLGAGAWLADRWRPAVLQVVLCCAAGGATVLSAGQTMHSHQISGWDEVVDSEGSVEVVWRVLEDARESARPDFDGSPRIMAEAEVLWVEVRGRELIKPVGAPAVIVMSLGEEEEWDGPASLPLQAGHRYRDTVRVLPTAAGERPTALLIPFGENPPERLEPDRRTAVADVFNRIRENTRQVAQAAWGDGPALLPGMVLGDRSAQSENLTGAMEDAGLSHLTVVSGTHCALILGALLGVARICRLPRWVTVVLVLLTLVLFVLLVHPKPSVIRAAVMGGIGAVAVFAGRGRVSSALLFVCVLILLIHDPWYAVTPAFQLSVAATLGIVLAGARLNEMFGRVLPGFLAGPLALTSSAQIFTIPVLLPLAEGVNTYTVPANLLAGPLLPLVTLPGTAAALLSGLWPLPAQGLMWLAGLPAAAIGWVGRRAAELPRAVADWPEGGMGLVLVALYLCAAVCGLRLLLRRRTCDAAGRISEEHPGSAGPARQFVVPRLLQAVSLAAAAGGMFALVLPFPSLGHTPSEAWRVALCDVGQGDMLVVRTGEQAGVVVDTGEDPDAADACLRRLSVDEIPLVMITHEHIDHYGGLPGVLRGRESSQVVYSGSREWEAPEELDFGGQSPDGLEIRRAARGDRGRVEGEFPGRFTVWAAEDHHSNPNDNSLVAHFELIDPDAQEGTLGSAADPLRLLTVGDLEEQAADRLLQRESLPLHVDVLKVAHHGAANGGTALIESRKPAVALIGVGEDNTYGHPHASILDALESAETVTYRTDQHGTVLLGFGEDGLRTNGG